jgi:hypothetical protein
VVLRPVICVDSLLPRCGIFHTPAVQYFAAREPPLIYTGPIDETRPNRKETTMLKLTFRYARYVLSTLATVGFGLGSN